ncbi:MAG: outer membrane protein assembly factor BamA [Rhizobiales bacterium]|nr:outer membrane protein assembly factor BamA [Hyphomicrobiales bacterium]
MGQLASFLTGIARVGGLSIALLMAASISGGLPANMASGLGTIAQAEEASSSVTVSSIDVQGNQRIEPETVRSYMIIQPGMPYSPELVDVSIKKLFDTGLFADITMTLEGSRLVVSVVENPVINRVAFEGNSAIKTENLDSEVQLKPRSIYTRSKVQSDVTRIIELYRRGGRFSATVDPKVIQLPQNRVDLVFEINEGPKTKISSINFIGNEEYSDSKLREVISTSESAWWKFFSSSDSYDPDRLTYDRELLRRFYLKNGYADFRVISAVADLSRDDSAFHITFTVEEGKIYKFGKIEINTKLEKLDKEMLASLVTTKEGDQYDASQIEKSVDALTYAAGTNGYAFAEVRPRVKRDREGQIINLVYQITEGPRVYVEKINITGNVRTLDRVIRRQFEMAEGDAFNRVLVDKSEKNIRALQYFAKVDITQQPGSAPDKTILNVNVEEQSTGSLSLSAGFSSVDSAVAGITLSERNFLGRGVQLSTSTSLSLRRQLIEFHYTDPYFLGRDLVGGIDLFGSETNYQSQASYDLRTIGGGFRFGFPLTDKSRLLTRYQLRNENIYNVDTYASQAVKDAEGTEVRSIIGYDYYYDGRNDPVDPTGGFDVLFSQDYAGAGGTVHYISSQVLVHTYLPITPSFLSSYRLDAGYIKGIGEDVSLNDRFFKGGNDFRGFKRGGLGPRDLASTNNDALGAQAYIFGSAELTIPNGLPEALGIKTSIFTDVGYIGIADYNKTTTPFAADDFAPRASAGLSIYWKSPFGPVRVDLSNVFLKEDYDETELFRFSAGTSF